MVVLKTTGRELNMENKKLFSAADAKKLAGKTLDEKIEDVLEAIKNFATAKHRKIRVGAYDYAADEDLWIHGGYSHTKEWNDACNKLTELGYKVRFVYEERQFVDMYTLIEW